MRPATCASYHQGSPHFSGMGRQCTCNVLMSFVHSKSSHGSPQTWIQDDLDCILDWGNTLYESVTGENKDKTKYLLIDELPKDVLNWNVIYSEPVTGPIISSSLSALDIEAPFCTLSDAIKNLGQLDMAFLTIGTTTPPSYTTGLIKEGNVFSVFDPHCRSASGMSCPDGTAVVTYHDGLDNIVSFYEDLARSINISECFFDFVPVEFQLKPTSDSDNETSSFGGFSEVDSEDEPLSMLSAELKKNAKDKHVDDIKETSFKSIWLEEGPDKPSDNEDFASSGSEYQPSKFEKKLMSSQVSSSNLDSSEPSFTLSPQKKHKKLKKRKTKGQKTEPNIETKQNKSTKKDLSNKPKGSICPASNLNQSNAVHYLKPHTKKIRGAIKCQLSDMRKIVSKSATILHAGDKNSLNIGMTPNKVLVQGIGSVNRQKEAGQVDIGTVSGQVDLGTVNGQVDIGAVNGQVGIGVVNGQVEDGQVDIGLEDGLVYMGVKDRQVDIGTVNEQVDIGPVNGQVYIGSVIEQVEGEQADNGTVNGQVDFVPVNRQVDFVPVNGQVGIGTVNGQVEDGQVDIGTVSGQVDIGAVNGQVEDVHVDIGLEDGQVYIGVKDRQEDIGTVNEQVDIVPVNGQVYIGSVNGQVEDEQADIGTVNGQVDFVLVNGQAGIGQVNGQVEDGQVDIGLEDGQVDLVPVNGQVGIGPVNGQVGIGSVNGQVDICTVNRQVDFGPVNGQVGTGTFNEQVDIGRVNGQVDNGTFNGQVDFGAASGQVDGQVNIVTDNTQVNIGPVNGQVDFGTVIGQVDSGPVDRPVDMGLVWTKEGDGEVIMSMLGEQSGDGLKDMGLFTDGQTDEMLVGGEPGVKVDVVLVEGQEYDRPIYIGLVDLEEGIVQADIGLVGPQGDGPKNFIGRSKKVSGIIDMEVGEQVPVDVIVDIRDRIGNEEIETCMGLDGHKNIQGDMGSLNTPENRQGDIGSMDGQENRQGSKGSGHENRHGSMGSIDGQGQRQEDMGSIDGQENRQGSMGSMNGQEYRQGGVGSEDGQENRQGLMESMKGQENRQGAWGQWMDRKIDGDMGSMDGQDNRQGSMRSGQENRQGGTGSLNAQDNRPGDIGSMDGQENIQGDMGSMNGQENRQGDMGSIDAQEKRQGDMGSVNGQENRQGDVGSVDGQENNQGDMGSIYGQENRQGDMGSMDGQENIEGSMGSGQENRQRGPGSLNAQDNRHGGMGSMNGQENRQGGMESMNGQDNRHGGMGSMNGQENRQGGMGSMNGQDNRQGGMGSMNGQENRQGGMGSMDGQENRQGGMGSMNGQENRQGGMESVDGQENRQGGTGSMNGQENRQGDMGTIDRQENRQGDMGSMDGQENRQGGVGSVDGQENRQGSMGSMDGQENRQGSMGSGQENRQGDMGSIDGQENGQGDMGSMDGQENRQGDMGSMDGQENRQEDVGFVKRGRKRLRDPSNWSRNISKRLKNTGKAYIDKKGNCKPAKMMKKGCGENCRQKCNQKFSRQERENIFNSYWGLGDITRQRDFLCTYCTSNDKKVTTLKSKSKRKRTFKWSLPTENDCTQTVCKTFFLHTLGISDTSVRTAFEKMNPSIGMCSSDKRGKHSTRPNKTKPEQLQDVRDHIESFPAVESHYCRKDSGKKYLSPGLSLSKMYKLYKTRCTATKKEEVSKSVYKRIFCTEYNIGFHKPLKDACDLCTQFENSNDEQKVEMNEEYQNHIYNKECASRHKEADKVKACSPDNDDFVAACFDLEQVLITPKSFQSSLYYKRRLNSFNLTVYDLSNRNGYSYIWNEAIAHRGGCEVASCIYSFLKTMTETHKKQIVLYSDNCCGQNKNKYYFSMLWYCLNKFNLKSIKHKYLEKGHTFNENDSVHSAVENNARDISVYTTPQWAQTIRTARPNKPYIVKEMGLEDFYDFAEVSDQMKNFEFDDDREKVYWSGVRTIELSDENPTTILFQYNYDGPLHKIDLVQQRRTRSDIAPPSVMPLSLLRDDCPKIGHKKYADLVSLCLDNTIPSVHHDFFINLPHE